MAITGVSTTNRMVGLSSGMDTETLVKNMLSTQQLKVDKSYRQNVKAKWKLEAYNELNTAVSSFRNSYLSTLGANSMVKSSVYNTYAVKMASNSAVSITADGTAQTSHFSITGVKLATADKATHAANSQRTGAFSAQGSLLKASATGNKGGLSDGTLVSSAFGLAEDEQDVSFSININGTAQGFTFDRDDTMADVKTALAEYGITLSFDGTGNAQLTGKTGDTLSLSNVSNKRAFNEAGVFGINEGAVIDSVTGVTGTKSGLSLTATIAEAFGIGESETLSFNIEGVDNSLTFSGSDTLADIADRLNAKGIDMTIVEQDADGKGKVNLKARDGATVSFTNGAGALVFNEEGAFGISEGEVARESAISGSTQLSALGISESTTFTINDQNITVNAGDTVQSLITAVNNSGAGVTMRYDALQGAFAITTNDDVNNPDAALNSLNITDTSGKIFGENGLTKINTGSYHQPASILRSDTIATMALKKGIDLANSPGVVDGKLKVTVNNKEFEFDVNTDTMSSMMNTINNSAADGVFNFSEIGDEFSISSAETGLNAELSFSGFDIFGLSTGSIQQGQNAEVTLKEGNTERVLRQSSNYFTMDGLTFSLTADFTAAADNSDALSVDVNRDYSPTVDSVKGLIKAYNELVTKLNTYYTEEINYKYDPLTEEEEDAVTEKQAEELTGKAKSGILRNDATIGSLLTNLRSAITVKVGDTGMSLQDLGITTVAWDSSKWKTEQGTLQLDEAKLQAALESDPNAVQNVLAATGSTTVTGSGADATSEAGFLTRIGSFMQQYNTTMRSSTIISAAQEVTDTAEKTDDLTQKLAEQEESYWKKFSTLETMMSQLNSQQSYLTSMISSLNSSK